jgi:hypothetical protein
VLQIGKTGVVLVVEPLGRKTGLGIRFGTWLLERGLTPKYGYIGVTREGSGGLWEQVYHQVSSLVPGTAMWRAAVAAACCVSADRYFGGACMVFPCAASDASSAWVRLQGYDSSSIQAKAKALTMELLISKSLSTQ